MRRNMPFSDRLLLGQSLVVRCQQKRRTWHAMLSRLFACVSMLAIVTAANATALAQYTVPPPMPTTQIIPARQPFPAPPAIPPIRQELITVEPSIAHVWVPGNWERAGSQWQWTAGSWKQPPNETAHWVGGYWKLQDRGYQWQAAHWGVVSNGLIVRKPIPLPAPVPEVAPPVPATGGSWVPGRWEWRAGHWVWIAGYYIQPPHPQAQWVAGHWAKGALGLWRWLPGHWRT